MRGALSSLCESKAPHVRRGTPGSPSMLAVHRRRSRRATGRAEMILAGGAGRFRGLLSVPVIGEADRVIAAARCAGRRRGREFDRNQDESSPIQRIRATPAGRRRLVSLPAAVVSTRHARWGRSGGRRELGARGRRPRPGNRVPGRLQQARNRGQHSQHPVLRPVSGGYRHAAADGGRLSLLRRDRGRPSGAHRPVPHAHRACGIPDRRWHSSSAGASRPARRDGAARRSDGHRRPGGVAV